MAIVMCLVARNYSRHGTTQNNGNEIGRFRCVMCFCNTSVIFYMYYNTFSTENQYLFFQITYFVYFDQNEIRGEQRHFEL